MFAIAAIDRERDVLYLARDHMGEKPLFVCQKDGAFWFSSELRPLLLSGIADVELTPELVSDYLLHGYIPEGRGTVGGVQTIEPGTAWTISLSDQGVVEESFWDPCDYLGQETLGAQQLADSIRDSVTVACQSDVPVGVALSGGLDSSVVAAVASSVRPDLRAFTVGYDVPCSTDETSTATRTANKLGIPLTRITVSVDEVAASYANVSEIRDEPIADISGPSYLAIAHACRQANVPVILSGQGGDELFWGYPWVRAAARMAQTGRAPLNEAPLTFLRSALASRADSFEALRSLGGVTTRRRLHRLGESTSEGSTAIPLWAASPGFPALHSRVGKLLGVKPAVPVMHYGATSTDDAPGLYMVAIIQTYLRTNGLAQMDRLTMQRSVEARTPLVDHRLVELALGAQGGGLSPAENGKRILRDAAALLLPEGIDLGRKQGFTPPVRTWLDAIWRKEAPGSAELALASTGLFREDRLRNALAAPQGRFGQVDPLAFRLLTLELWWRGLT
jgi:asparagine synthase (glutamine-hydrolysing)